MKTRRGNFTARRGRGPERTTFRSLTNAEIAEFAAVVAQHGYDTPLDGLLAITSGELATVLLDSDERWQLGDELERHADSMPAGWLAEGVRAIADQLRTAARREAASRIRLGSTALLHGE